MFEGLQDSLDRVKDSLHIRNFYKKTLWKAGTLFLKNISTAAWNRSKSVFFCKNFDERRPVS